MNIDYCLYKTVLIYSLKKKKFNSINYFLTSSKKFKISFISFCTKLYMKVYKYKKIRIDN